MCGSFYWPAWETMSSGCASAMVGMLGLQGFTSADQVNQDKSTKNETYKTQVETIRTIFVCLFFSNYNNLVSACTYITHNWELGMWQC